MEEALFKERSSVFKKNLKKKILRWRISKKTRYESPKKTLFKPVKEKWEVNYKGMVIWQMTDFLVTIITTRRQWNNSFHMPRENISEYKILYTTK